MKKLSIIVPLFIISFVLVSCSGIKEIENYKGENISMGIGEFSSVKMNADTKGGYSWVVSGNSDPKIASYENTEKISAENSSSQDTVFIKFKGLKKGKTIITLNYVKKGDFIAHKTRTVNITVY